MREQEALLLHFLSGLVEDLRGLDHLRVLIILSPERETRGVTRIIEDYLNTSSVSHVHEERRL